jgi:hypothetical protein
MRLGKLEVVKKADLPGVNSVTASVMTAIPKKRLN